MDNKAFDNYLSIFAKIITLVVLVTISLPCNGLSYFTSIKALEIYVLQFCMFHHVENRVTKKGSIFEREDSFL
ncbi:hypothetical protein T07_2831 [Trichinella nelsoni]|uniref:Uncharacterized protein n=1 Tax=Trichinella nelsoni TaxID=6336 RepID=A0A0V0RST9_9BILA|nr:hypothetical protein T07_2831 [Trichinella nelsoni]